ncbi:staphylopine uptake ABC transporter permease subunit CntC [Paenibacillus phyllosphaerae]|nr:nickel/cobalt ABC transporter permease [Paenibacillus phyllosphaerae]
MRLLTNLLQDKLAVLSLAVIGLILAAGAMAPVFAPHDPNAVNMDLRYAGASWHYLLGNDHLGRCILSRLIYGIRPSVLGVLAALFVSVALGAFLGLVAGYFKGKTDAVIMRVCDIMLSFPGYVMTLAIVGILGVGLGNILLAFMLLKWAWFARIIRASVLQAAEADYIKFARITGVPSITILLRHVVPVVSADIAVVASSSFGSMILQLSGFSFLGLGVQAPNAEWGMMLNEARDVMFSRPELMLAPGLAIVLTVSAVNFMSDALQTALDPTLSKTNRKFREQASLPVKLRGKEVA